MTKRAERLGAYLEAFGWNVYGHSTRCPNCHAPNFDCSFCGKCGVELPLKDMKKEALAELEGAIQYALKEKGHKKIEEN